MTTQIATPAPEMLTVTPLGFPWETADPFLFCVHHLDRYPQGNERMGPDASLAGRNLGQDFTVKDGFRMYHGEVVPGFPQHPHRGFETVTIMRQGFVDHADSLGATARFGSGDVQWLTAGQGIVHAEMFPLRERAEPNPLELFQIWLNLPAADKFAPPHFAPHARFDLPPARAGTNRSIYFFRGGRLRLADRELDAYARAILDPLAAVELQAGEDGADILLLQGKPIGEPVVQYGPFVMNTQAQIGEALRDYQRTRFGGWPWDRDDPVHPRERGRFARHADGRVEEADRDSAG